MSRIAKSPLNIPKGVSLKMSGQTLTVTGAKASLSYDIPEIVGLEIGADVANIAPSSIEKTPALSGTVRANVNNMIVGVTDGFEKKLTLIGVGYRAQSQGKVLNLSLGFSHPVEYPIPEGITIETPSQTEVVVRGADKQVVGQVAADIRGYRPPEPYKGKGVRYLGERVVMKEAKKK